ncbi:MAG: hypothetical protein R3D84_13350 [Paracoccaceae bacterium]
MTCPTFRTHGAKCSGSAALHAETPQKATVMAAQGPLPQRLTIYTMNTALIIAAMPVGSTADL